MIEEELRRCVDNGLTQRQIACEFGVSQDKCLLLCSNCHREKHGGKW